MSHINKPSAKSIKAHQAHILSIAEGFFESSILFALLKLEIFEFIGEGSKTLQDLADNIKAEPETLKRLLNAGVFFKLLELDEGTTYTVSPTCRDVLIPAAGDNYLGNFIRNLGQLRSAVLKLDEAVLTSSPTINPLTLLRTDRDQIREFTLAMHNYASLSGKELASILDTSNCNTLLDLGSGPGTYAFYLGLQNPNLKLYLLDYPEVLEIAREIEKKFSLKNEVHYIAGDFFKEEIKGSYDIILVSNTLHMIGERASRELINKIYGNINKGGSLVIQARFLRDDRIGYRWPIFLDLIQLCITEEGRNHTVSETKQWLEEAGFVNVEYNPMSMYNANNYIRGYKP